MPLFLFLSARDRLLFVKANVEGEEMVKCKPRDRMTSYYLAIIHKTAYKIIIHRCVFLVCLFHSSRFIAFVQLEEARWQLDRYLSMM